MQRMLIITLMGMAIVGVTGWGEASDTKARLEKKNKGK